MNQMPRSIEFDALNGDSYACVDIADSRRLRLPHVEPRMDAIGVREICSVFERKVKRGLPDEAKVSLRLSLALPPAKSSWSRAQDIVHDWAASVGPLGVRHGVVDSIETQFTTALLPGRFNLRRRDPLLIARIFMAALAEKTVPATIAYQGVDNPGACDELPVRFPKSDQEIFLELMRNQLRTVSSCKPAM